MKRFFIIISLYFLPAALLNGQVGTGAESKENSLVISDSVDVLPEFPGGLAALYQYLIKNIHYPRAAREDGIQGKVYLTFIVEADGNISNVRVIRGIGGGCDEVAAGAIRQMPPWKPGLKEGKPVRVQLNVPVSFGHGSGGGYYYSDDEAPTLVKGRRFYRRMEYESAFNIFNMLLSEDPENQEALYYRGMCSYFLGNREQSCTDLGALKNPVEFKNAVKTKEVVCKE